VDERESFLPFAEFPWFREAPIAAVVRVEFTPPDHLHWPLLDVDLSVESLRNPERFPLVSRVRPKPARRRRTTRRS
jgi:hypothetical protein